MKETSIRCGRSACTCFNRALPSGCAVYEDRRLCPLSMRNREKNACHSRKRQLDRIPY